MFWKIFIILSVTGILYFIHTELLNYYSYNKEVILINNNHKIFIFCASEGAKAKIANSTEDCYKYLLRINN